MEAERGIRLAEHGYLDVEIAPVPETGDGGIHDTLVKLVREMHNLESRLNFVGYGMSCDQWMLD